MTVPEDDVIIDAVAASIVDGDESTYHPYQAYFAEKFVWFDSLSDQFFISNQFPNNNPASDVDLETYWVFVLGQLTEMEIKLQNVCLGMQRFNIGGYLPVNADKYYRVLFCLIKKVTAYRIAVEIRVQPEVVLRNFYDPQYLVLRSEVGIVGPKSKLSRENGLKLRKENEEWAKNILVKMNSTLDHMTEALERKGDTVRVSQIVVLKK